jgi:hypothetical protein
MKLIDLISVDKEFFFEMVKICNETYRSSHDFSTYHKIIHSHRQKDDITTLIMDNDFIKGIYETLQQWNMDQKGAILEKYEVINKSIFDCQEYIAELYGIHLSDIDKKELGDLKDTLYLLFRNLKVMKSKRRIVGVSKTMHFLLPDLIMPIDGKYTMNSFFGYNKISKEASSEFDDMYYILNKFHDICCKYELSFNDCGSGELNTSVPKLIDNAIIGLTNNLEYAIDYLKSKR